LIALIELCFTDFRASEIVTGYTGAQMQCPAAGGSGRKTQAITSFRGLCVLCGEFFLRGRRRR
jgi:hypothetical protein